MLNAISTRQPQNAQDWTLLDEQNSKVKKFTINKTYT